MNFIRKLRENGNLTLLGFSRYFLEAGYAVIYLYRLKSLQPFERLVNFKNLFKSLQIKEDGSIKGWREFKNKMSII